MKHTGLFKVFLDDVVNLNTSRLEKLEDSVEDIKKFIRRSSWPPQVRDFLAQGSWAQKTIIKPVKDGPFDADLLVCVDPVEGWEAKDYVNSLRNTFKSSLSFADKVTSFSHCVTITYADERKIDIAPLVIERKWRGSSEVCNRSDNEFEDSAPKDYTDWFNEKNGYSGQNSFRKVTRLLKYLRGIKKTFTCPSVLLTTLLGERLTWLDKDTLAFQDTPSALQAILGRFDDYLQGHETKPVVGNPSMPAEDFADLWSDDEYTNFRTFVHKYRGWVDEAIGEEDFGKSIAAWQRVFGDEFGKSAVAKIAGSAAEAQTTVGTLLSSVARHSDRLVEAVRDYGSRILPASFYRPPHLHQPSWVRAQDANFQVFVTATYKAHRRAHEGRAVASGETLPSHGGLWFEAHLWGGSPIGSGYRVEWRVTNTGMLALSKRQGRGDFYIPSSGNRRWEDLCYRGVHFVEAFLIRCADEKLVGKSPPFDVVIL